MKNINLIIKTVFAFFLIALLQLAINCGSKKKTKKEAPMLPINQTLSRLIGDKASLFATEIIPQDSSKDVFEIESKNGKIVLRGSSQNAIGYAFNWYLRYYAHSQIARVGVNINLPSILPEVREKVRVVSPYQYRYYLNYCTYNYTMSFWEWDQWERELDWMAINGINMPLAIIGMEAVWQNTLRKFDFTENEISKFICGPAYTAWWLMGNLEGAGGHVSQAWIDSRVVLQKRILARMRELGMKPVLHGFYGMVPDAMRQKFPANKIIYGGKWGSFDAKNGFDRPAFLNPEDTLFGKMAAVYYKELTKLYGEAAFYGGDPFHEGGSTEGINIAKAATEIQKAMQKSVPDSKWLLQGWEGNPKDELLSGVDKTKAVIIDLNAESRYNWEKRNSYGQTPWIWTNIPQWGGRMGMYGKLDSTGIEPVRALNSAQGKYMVGIGAIPEADDNNPVVYELIYEMAWRKDSPKTSDWIKTYSRARYGLENSTVEMGWDLLAQSVYNCRLKSDGAHESFLCARPALKLDRASTWGSTFIYYDIKMLENAATNFIKSSGQLGEIDSYKYDLIDVTRQVLSDKGHLYYAQLTNAFAQKDKAAFKMAADQYLQLMLDLDTVLATRKEFMLGPWIADARKMAKSPSEEELFEYNAKALVTTWGISKETSFLLHEYANHEWAGLMGDYYYMRWKIFINELNNQLNGAKKSDIDWYPLEEKWVKNKTKFTTVPTGNEVKIAQKMLSKYIQQQ